MTERNSIQTPDSKYLPFITKYPRPKKFTNSWNHFPSKEINKILEKKD